MLRKLTSVLPDRFRPKSHVSANVVACLRLQGVIAASGARPVPGPSSSRISLASHEDALRRAFELPGLRALALVVNSPGGSPAQSSLLYQRIRKLRERAAAAHGREFLILCFVEDVAASGGYYIACAADEIYADPNSIIGSIGAVHQSFGLHGIVERLGLERRLVAAGEHKVRNDPFRPLNPEDVAKLQALLKTTHDNFISAVRASRGAKLRGPDSQLFEGDVFLAAEAAQLGLIDGVGELESTCRAKFGEDTTFVAVHPPRKGLLEALAQGPFGASSSSLGGLLRAAAASSGGGAVDAGAGVPHHQQVGYDLLDGALSRLHEQQVWDASCAGHARW